ncbi:MAG: SUF system Fe-S cluster assembly regulator [Gammaproteobacteria bacterium RIFCSPHIGHO2_12_FULL_45_9]|nr:MAG: SUF system Fe-S cluster assembly regulator [Gammaproteobacteria bacterium RIFCSPHIGHO2_12_FULL_45_9]
MLKVSKMADYAALLMHRFVASERTWSATELAAVTALPQPTVSKLLKRLQQANLLLSTRGPQGGYGLNGSPDTITLLDVIVAIDGMPLVTECALGEKGRCMHETVCHMQSHWAGLNRRLIALLRSMSLAEFVKGV